MFEGVEDEPDENIDSHIQAGHKPKEARSSGVLWVRRDKERGNGLSNLVRMGGN